MAKIRVLVVDDSALVRKLLTEILNSDPEIEVVDTAIDPHLARNKIKELNPDVLTLDIEMPRMDGITFLRNLMRLRPMPVVMISTLTEKGADITLEALEIGAVDFVAKPKTDLSNSLGGFAEEIIAKVKAAAAVPKTVLERVRPSSTSLPKIEPRFSTDAVLPKSAGPTRVGKTQQIIAIGASTGGTEAIKDVISALPADSPAIVITQHIPVAFSGPFARRVNGLSAMTVKEAEDGEAIHAGHVYIAPGDQHLLIERRGDNYYCRLNDGPPVSRHKPSVDVLFRSVAQSAGANAVGVMLTGMGNDGAEGMLEMRQAGAHNLIQDAASSVVWGMPGAAFEAGAADTTYPLQKIAAELIRLYAK
jgi:two-component system chemotaxis response regulator CheB